MVYVAVTVETLKDSSRPLNGNTKVLTPLLR